MDDKITHHSVFTEIRLNAYKSPSGVNQLTSTVWPKGHERKQLKSNMSVAHNDAEPNLRFHILPVVWRENLEKYTNIYICVV